MSKVPSSHLVLHSIKPITDFEYPAPPNTNKLPTVLEIMTMNEASLLGTGGKKSSIVGPVMLADGDRLLRPTFCPLMKSRLPVRQNRTLSSDSMSVVLCLPLQRPCQWRLQYDTAMQQVPMQPSGNTQTPGVNARYKACSSQAGRPTNTGKSVWIIQGYICGM
jgi:hypothetical protein